MQEVFGLKQSGENILNHFSVNCSSLLTPPSADITSFWILLSESDLYGSSERKSFVLTKDSVRTDAVCPVKLLSVFLVLFVSSLTF